MVSSLKLLIKNNIKTFFSIMILIMLGVGFLVGMKSTVPNLKHTVSNYFDKLNVFDFELTSSIDFSKEEILEFQKVKGIKKIEGSYSKDFIIKGKTDDYVLRIHSYKNDNDTINKIELLEGKLPSNENEIVIEESLYKNQEYNLGDLIVLNSDFLKNQNLKIVGIIKSPLYLSNNKGTTNLLSGRVNYYAYINYDNINSDLFNIVYIKVEKDYNENEILESIKTVGKNVLEKRFEKTIEELNQKIEKGQNEIDARKSKTNEQIRKYELEIENAEAMIASAEKSIPSISEAKKILDNKQNELNKVKAELDQAKSQIDNARKEYNEALNEYNKYYEIVNNLDHDDGLYDFFNSSLERYKKKLDESKEELEIKQNEYDLAYAEYQKVLNALNAKTPEELISIAKKEVENKKIILNNRKKELEENKKIVYNEFQNFQNQLDDAKDYLKLISVNGWKINKRNDIPSYSQYLSDINRVEKIGNFFPIIFYVVAVLITLTNISRIVTSDRDKIGLYKALGYTNKYISNSYILFSVISCLLGSILGSIVGLYLIPKIFYNIYKLIYYLPTFTYLFNYIIIIIAALIALLLVIISSHFSIKDTIKSWPAILLRPKVSNEGKRILIEKIPFIWKKINFTNKVTFRNMFKYPKRFIMMILGISGCISLIIAGFSIKTAITNIIPLQFGNVFDINAEIFFKDSISRETIQNEKERISNLDEIENSILSYIKYVYIDNNTTKINLVIPEDNDLLLDFVTFKNNNKNLELSNDGVLVTKKLARTMNIKFGDTIKLTDVDNNQFEVIVDNIIDNYIDNYIYISKDYYTKLLGNSPKYNALLIRNKNKNYSEEKLSLKLNETNNISYLIYTSTSKIMYDSLTKSLNYIVYTLVISAIILAFIVLYNLNSLNIEERKREIATIKVLGFYPNETYKYIENEIKRLTLIGIIIGLFLGYIFSKILIKGCELDNLMYDYSIHILNYVYAIAITIIFMIGTSLICRKNINKIDMVESLKKTE